MFHWPLIASGQPAVNRSVEQSGTIQNAMGEIRNSALRYRRTVCSARSPVRKINAKVVQASYRAVSDGKRSKLQGRRFVIVQGAGLKVGHLSGANMQDIVRFTIWCLHMSSDLFVPHEITILPRNPEL